MDSVSGVWIFVHTEKLRTQLTHTKLMHNISFHQNGMLMFSSQDRYSMRLSPHRILTKAKYSHDNTLCVESCLALSLSPRTQWSPLPIFKSYTTLQLWILFDKLCSLLVALRELWSSQNTFLKHVKKFQQNRNVKLKALC